MTIFNPIWSGKVENEYEKSSRVRLLTILHLFSNLVHFLTLIDAAFWSVKEAGGGAQIRILWPLRHG